MHSGYEIIGAVQQRRQDHCKPSVHLRLSLLPGQGIPFGKTIHDAHKYAEASMSRNRCDRPGIHHVGAFKHDLLGVASGNAVDLQSVGALEILNSGLGLRAVTPVRVARQVAQLLEPVLQGAYGAALVPDVEGVISAL